MIGSSLLQFNSRRVVSHWTGNDERAYHTYALPHFTVERIVGMLLGIYTCIQDYQSLHVCWEKLINF